MIDYLSDEWLEAASVMITALVLDPPLEGSLTIEQAVTGAPSGAVRYRITIEGPSLALRRTEPSGESDPDIRFTQDYATAAAVAQGQQSAQWAFMHGKLQVGGDITRMISCSAALDALGDAFATLRARTSF